MFFSSSTLAVSALTFFAATNLFAASPKEVQVVMKNAKGEQIGTAKLTAVAKGVDVALDIKGVSPGEHALHFHEKGSCVAPKFESAGAHFARDNKVHGHVNGGPHAGDMPNVKANEKGVIQTKINNPYVVLSGSGGNSLTKSGGTALVLHEKPDDFKSQPAGNAGDRIACGEVKAGTL